MPGSGEVFILAQICEAVYVLPASRFPRGEGPIRSDMEAKGQAKVNPSPTHTFYMALSVRYGDLVSCDKTTWMGPVKPQLFIRHTIPRTITALNGLPSGNL